MTFVSVAIVSLMGVFVFPLLAKIFEREIKVIDFFIAISPEIILLALEKAK